MTASIGELESMIEGRAIAENEERWIKRMMIQVMMAPYAGWVEGHKIYRVQGFDNEEEEEEVVPISEEQLKEAIARMDKTLKKNNG